MLESRWSSQTIRPACLQALVERGLGQRVEDVDGLDGRLGGADEVGDGQRGLLSVGVETHDEAHGHLDPVAVERVNDLKDRLLEVDGFLDGAQGAGFGRFDAAKHVGEKGVPHLRQDIRVLRQAQGRLTGQAHLAVPFILPGHQVFEQFAGGLGVADEIVVHKIDRGRAGGGQEIQFADDLRRVLMAGAAPVEGGDVAVVAGMGATAGELHRAQEVVADVDQVIGGHRQLGHRQAFNGAEDDLSRGALGGAVDEFEQPACGVTRFPAVDDVGFGIPFRRGRGRRATQHDRSASPVRPDDDVLNSFPLDVHAGGEHDVGPAQVLLRGGLGRSRR